MQTNNYQQRYHKFIKSRPIRTKVKFDGCETHHILPRSLGGSNDPSNLIVLTAREHFIAHLMLIKCYKGKNKSKMVYALMKLSVANGNHHDYRLTSRRYEIIKKFFAKVVSKEKKALMKDPVWKKKWLEKVKEANKKRKGVLKPGTRPDMNQRWQDPEYRKKVSDKIRQSVLKRFKDKEYHERIKKGNQKRNSVYSSTRLWTQERRDKVKATWMAKSTSFRQMKTL